MKALVFSLFSAVLSGCVSHTNAPDRTYPLPDHEWRVTRDVVFTPADWPEPLESRHIHAFLERASSDRHDGSRRRLTPAPPR